MYKWFVSKWNVGKWIDGMGNADEWHDDDHIYRKMKHGQVHKREHDEWNACTHICMKNKRREAGKQENALMKHTTNENEMHECM